MNNYFIEYNENIEVLKFKKMQEFKDKVDLVVTLKTHKNGFKVKADSDVRKTKFLSVSNYIGINNMDIILPIQAHTDNIVCIKYKTEKKLINIDGLITNVKNIPIATTFADCTPLFFYDPIKNVIANIHSGWLGTTKKIGEKAVKILIEKYNCKAENILCFIGPSIREDHFLVNEDVKNIFENKFKQFIYKYKIIKNTDRYNEKGKQYSIDTILVNKIILKNIGILEKNIYDCGLCTMCNKDKFHSRRIEGKNYETNTGIMILK